MSKRNGLSDRRILGENQRALSVWLCLPLLLVCFMLFGGKAVRASGELISPQTLRVGTFTFSRNLDSLNFAERVIGEALRLHGYDMKVEYYPGKRLMAQLNSGALDGDLIRAANLAYGFENIIRVEEPLITTCGLIFGLVERGEVVISDTGQTVRVGIYDGVPDALTKLVRQYPHVDLVFFKKLRQGVDMLEHHRIEFITLAGAQEEAFIRLMKKPVKLVGGILLEPGYFHLHSRHRELAEALAPTLRQVKQRHPVHHCSRELLDRRLAQAKQSILQPSP